jgi:lysophospholipase L1-like esterase
VNATFWDTIDARLAHAGVTPQQVQAIWLKEAEAGPDEAFPLDAQILQRDLEEIVRIIKSRYPNARQVYTSSRIYAGYAVTSLNPEPFAYQSGFAVRWMIEAQLAGAPLLNFNSARGAVLAPWLAWGPYLWADGLNARSDGLVWECADFQSDGTHPSSSGSAKVAQMLLRFFQTDPIASRWYRDCDPSDPAVFSAPPRVLDVGIGFTQETAERRLEWESLGPVTGPATRYDVVAGDLGDLRQNGGFEAARCAAASVPDSALPDPEADPPVGEGVYYLVRGRNGCGIGTFGEPGALAGPRDGLDTSSPCPD